MFRTFHPLAACSLLLLFACVAINGRARQVQGTSGDDTLAAGRLIPASATMCRAWEIPSDPTSDSLLLGDNGGASIRRGFAIFTHTFERAPAYSPNALTCSNCHLNAGQRERALPLVGIAVAYPEFNKRAGRLFSLEDRIIECFKRSMDATKDEHAGGTSDHTLPQPLSATTPAVADVAAYLRWLGRGFKPGDRLPWRGQNTIASAHAKPVRELDTAAGHTLFLDRCSSCHGEDGQGVEIGDKKAGPLWGPLSWNDGAGAARVLTLAGIIRYAMPYLDPGSLTDLEAQEIASWINTRPRPVYPYKNADYPGAQPPPDALYYSTPRAK